PLTVSSGGAFAIGSNNATVGAITLNGGGQITGSSGVLTSDVPVALQSGTLSASLAGLASVTKTGPGTATLAATTQSAYSGGTFVNQGVLAVNAATALPTTAQSLSISSGAVAQFNYGISNATLGLINASSQGVLALGTANASALDLSLVASPNVSLGAVGNVTYAGLTLSGSSGVYRLGGGSGTLTLNTNNLLAGANSVSVSGT